MSSQELRIDYDFENLIPPLTEDEYSRLEQSIRAEGCRDAIIVWNNVIIDGHHRYKICKAHNIDFHTIQMEFSLKDDVILWMLQNQLGRRNLSEFQRVEIVRKYEEAVKAQAEQRMLAGKADPKVNLPEGQKSRKQSRDELGTLAGVSGSTYEHATKVIDHAPTPIVNAARNNQISINAAYEVTKLPEPQQSEIAERIEQGEPAKSVISEVRSRNRKQKTETPANTDYDVSPQSTTSEASLRSEELNAQHEANSATMNEEKQPKEVLLHKRHRHSIRKYKNNFSRMKLASIQTMRLCNHRKTSNTMNALHSMICMIMRKKTTLTIMTTMNVMYLKNIMNMKSIQESVSTKQTYATT